MRWNSTYEMLNRFEEQEEAVKVALVRLDSPVCGLEREDWLTLTELTKVLSPSHAIAKISAEKCYCFKDNSICLDFAGISDSCPPITSTHDSH